MARRRSQNREAHYWAGTIIWLDLHRALMAARANAHLKPEDGLMPSAATRLELSTKYGSMVDDGIAHLRRAIELDPQYADAMTYLNLLIRERAQYRDTPEQFSRDVAEADGWVKRALDARRTSAQGPGRGALAGATVESAREVSGRTSAPASSTSSSASHVVHHRENRDRRRVGACRRDGARSTLGACGRSATPETIGRVAAEIRQIDEHSRVSVTLGPDSSVQRRDLAYRHLELRLSSRA